VIFVFFLLHYKHECTKQLIALVYLVPLPFHCLLLVLELP
jgi:hypothetical protein